jgi:hypothetical protein
VKSDREVPQPTFTTPSISEKVEERSKCHPPPIEANPVPVLSLPGYSRFSLAKLLHTFSIDITHI